MTDFDQYRPISIKIDRFRSNLTDFYQNWSKLKSSELSKSAIFGQNRLKLTDNFIKIYGYGCYCLNLGDRPLTGNLSGVEPVDETDALCHKWTKCNRCARHDHDEFCTPETVKYKFDVIGEGGNREVQCTDRKEK